MKVVWNCDQVNICQAYGYYVEMEGKIEWPNRYVGYGDGTPDGTYNGTPVTMEAQFYKDCLEYNPVMYIHMAGSTPEAKHWEKKEMDTHTVNTNEQFYNSSRSNGFKMSIDLDTVLGKIETGAYEIVKEPFDVILQMESGQKARIVDYVISHVNWIRDQVNDTMGKWLEGKDDPIIVLQDYFEGGKDWRISKRHTVLGISRTKFKPDMNVVYIPKSDWSKLEDYEIREIALLDNPVQQDKSLENELDAVADTMYDCCIKENRDQNDPVILDKLKRMGYGDTAIKGLKVRIKNKLANSTKGLAPNELFNPTTSQEGESIADGYRIPAESQHALSISSGFKGKIFEKITEAIRNDDVRKKKNWIISVYHPDLKSYLGWEKKKVQLRSDLNNLEDWLKVTTGKGADETVIQQVTFLIREKDPITLRQ